MREVFVFSEGGQEASASCRQSLCAARDLAGAKEILCHQDFCLILIDLVPRPERGLELAHFVRELPDHCLTPIIFLAEDFTYEKRAFHEFHCYDYLIKPIGREDIIEIIYLCLTRLFPEKKRELLRFRIHGATYLVNIHEVIYMESVNRSVFIHMAAGQVIEVPYMKLRDCLDNHGDVLVQCHRAILVNWDYVRGFDGAERCLELSGCPDRPEIGRTFEKKIKSRFDSWQG